MLINRCFFWNTLNKTKTGETMVKPNTPKNVGHIPSNQPTNQPLREPLSDIPGTRKVGEEISGEATSIHPLRGEHHPVKWV